MKLLIIGAGIGGLTAAVALRNQGFDVHVYEQALALREVGAGVAIGPNAVRVLQRLGLGEALRARGVISLSMDPRDWQTGEVLARVPLGDAAVARWGAPFYHFHRADLHSLLRAKLGDEHITLGSRCIAVEQEGERVAVQFADGRSAEGELLIGADGIHSVVREHVAGPDRAVWSGQLSWRGLAPAVAAKAVGLEMRHHSFWGPGRQFVCFYVSGGEQVNWVGNMESHDDWRHESWAARGERNEALQQYEGWHPQVRALIAATEEVFKWALFDRRPLDRWTRGRVTLLGDAAHPMLPFMAQGASQSIEDALVLAQCLATSNGSTLALESYVSLRRERTARMQAASREMSQRVLIDDQAAVAARNAQMLQEGDNYAARYDWIYGYDAGTAASTGTQHGS